MLILMKTASSAYSNQTTRNNERFDANDANPESRTGILQDTSSGKLERESEDDYACPGMLKLDDAFNKIGDVMTSLQERSSDSTMMNDERDELVLELSRSLWSLHMAGYHFEKLVEENKSLNLASPHVALRLSYLTDMLHQLRSLMEQWFQILKWFWPKAKMNKVFKILMQMRVKLLLMRW